MYLASRNVKKTFPDDFFTLRGPLGDLPEWRPRSSKTLLGAKEPPWTAQGPLKGHPGGPRAPLDHPCEFRPCTVIFENLRCSSFTHISNVFSICFDYHSCFTNFHLSHFTHISNVFSTIYKQHNISETPPLDAREPLWDPSRASECKKYMTARVAHTAGTEAQN